MIDTVVPSSSAVRPFNLHEHRRPSLIVAPFSDRLAHAVIYKMEPYEHDLGKVSIVCQAVGDNDQILDIPSGQVIIKSVERLKRNRAIRPVAPQSILPESIRQLGGPSWQILISQAVVHTKGETFLDDVARQITAWFTFRWDQAQLNCLPWGQLITADSSSFLRQTKDRSARIRQHHQRRREERCHW